MSFFIALQLPWDFRSYSIVDQFNECDMIANLFFRRLISVTGLLMATVVPATAFAQDDAWSTMAPILDKHCARCHQSGKTTGRYKERPAADFGYVLDQDTLIGRHKLVPGNADASEIMIKIVKGDMPKDTDDACNLGTATDKDYCGLTDKEKTALHDAIDALKVAAPAPQVVAAAGAEPAPATSNASPKPVSAGDVPAGRRPSSPTARSSA